MGGSKGSVGRRDVFIDACVGRVGREDGGGGFLGQAVEMVMRLAGRFVTGRDGAGISWSCIRGCGI